VSDFGLALPCRCGHVRGEHARNYGECLDDDCRCESFFPAEVNLKKSARRVLFAIAMTGPLASINEAARVFGVTRQAVNVKLAGLVRLGLVLVRRGRVQRGVHGAIAITLTPAGEELATHCPTCGAARATNAKEKAA